MLAARGKQIGAGEIAAAEAEAALVHHHPGEDRDPGWLPLCAIFTVKRKLEPILTLAFALTASIKMGSSFRWNDEVCN